MTREELMALIEHWNGIITAKPFGRAIEEPSACDVLWKRLKRLRVAIVQAAIDEEAMEPQPDILGKRFLGRCLCKDETDKYERKTVAFLKISVGDKAEGPEGMGVVRSVCGTSVMVIVAGYGWVIIEDMTTLARWQFTSSQKEAGHESA